MSPAQNNDHTEFSLFRERLYEIIFEADTPAGKLFDVILLLAILGSVLAVMMETVPSYAKYLTFFVTLEWIFTIFFTIEYLVRIYTVHSPKKYMTSFFGVIDLISILPTYIGIFIHGTSSLMVIRAIRLLRVFRIFKLGNFLFEGQIIMKALKESRDKILVFMFFIVVMVTIFGSIIFFIESHSPIGHEGFTSIPKSVYWAVVTLSTVGYGDVYPNTAIGQFLSSILMILAYAVIAVPTGIITAEFSKSHKRKRAKMFTTQVCSFCLKDGHDKDSEYCKYCGGHLHLAELKEKEIKKNNKNRSD